jgi:hypothetical protein
VGLPNNITIQSLGRRFAIALLTTFITVQLSPYLALAKGAQPGPPSPDLNALTQLAQLPDGMVALPDFDPAVNGFQFSNAELLQAIDLTRNAQAWEEVLTPQLQQLFGTQICSGGDSANCVLTAAAQSWLRTQLDRMNQGLSEGMAAAVLDLWQPTQPRLPWWQRLINFVLGQTVFGLARTLFELQTFIANLFLMQGVTEVFEQTQTVRNTWTPSQILQSIVRVFLTGSGDPFTMGVFRLVAGVLTEGHALTPYRVEDRGSGQYWVYVYDSNYPAGRSASPANLHMEFDTRADTWRYQPVAEGPEYRGDAQSKTLDLTQRSWRQPPATDQPPTIGPFSCPFCRPITEADAEFPPDPSLDITLIGEGQLTVVPVQTAPSPSAPRSAIALVPFKGGLNRDVPASYHLPVGGLGQGLQVTLTGTATAQSPATLQITGPGYAATVDDLKLGPNQAITLFCIPSASGLEVTFVASRATTIPGLAISLTDDTNVYEFDSSTPDTGFSLTQRQVSKSSGFTLSDLKLSPGQRAGLAANTRLKRLYFADDNGTDSQYSLAVRNRLAIQDRIQIGERQPDFINYTLAYDEEMRASNLQVESRNQAFFDYDPAFVDPANLPRQDLLAAVEQRNFPIAIAYEPLAIAPTGPLQIAPSAAEPIGRRVFQGSLRKESDKTS